MHDKECDFIIKVAGEDVTRLVAKWDVKEVDDGMSSCSVVIVNQDMALSGLFQIEHDVEIMFGTPSDMSNRVSMKIKSVTESYNNSGFTIEILGQDIVSEIDGKSMRGMYKAGTDPVKAIKDTVESATGNKAKVTVDLESPKLKSYAKLPCDGPVWSVIGWLSNMCNTKSV